MNILNAIADGRSETLGALGRELSGVTNTIEHARGLPNSLYRGGQAPELERQSVFAANWTGIGFAKDIPENGDVKPVEFFGEPLLLVRDREGAIRVFHNVCRHRGVVLVSRPHHTTGLIRCPYHAWCYDLTGRLKQTPHAGGPGIHEHAALDKSALGLVEVRSHVFLDVVFVNLSGNAPAFESCFGSLGERWKDFQKPLFHSGDDSCFTLDVKCNWKLAVENYCESYHLPFVHPGLNAYSRLEDHENILGDGPWAGQLSRVYSPPLDSAGRRFSQFEGLSERWRSNAEYLAVYPNVLMGVHKDHCYAILLEPVSHEHTREHVSICYASQEMTGADFDRLRAQNTRLWRDVFVEDVGVVESMQRGRGGDGFDGGHFSPAMDESTHHFHAWIARQITDLP